MDQFVLYVFVVWDGKCFVVWVFNDVMMIFEEKLCWVIILSVGFSFLKMLEGVDILMYLKCYNVDVEYVICLKSKGGIVEVI